jgi:hypothetical protein
MFVVCSELLQSGYSKGLFSINLHHFPAPCYYCLAGTQSDTLSRLTEHQLLLAARRDLSFQDPHGRGHPHFFNVERWLCCAASLQHVRAP